MQRQQHQEKNKLPRFASNKLDLESSEDENSNEDEEDGPRIPGSKSSKQRDDGQDRDSNGRKIIPKRLDKHRFFFFFFLFNGACSGFNY